MNLSSFRKITKTQLITKRSVLKTTNQLTVNFTQTPMKRIFIMRKKKGNKWHVESTYEPR